MPEQISHLFLHFLLIFLFDVDFFPGSTDFTKSILDVDNDGVEKTISLGLVGVSATLDHVFIFLNWDAAATDCTTADLFLSGIDEYFFSSSLSLLLM